MSTNAPTNVVDHGHDCHQPARFPSRTWFRSLWVWCGIVVVAGTLGIVATLLGDDRAGWSVGLRIVVGAAIVWQGAAIVVESRRFKPFWDRRANAERECPRPDSGWNPSGWWWLGVGVIFGVSVLWLLTGSQRAQSLMVAGLGAFTSIEAIVKMRSSAPDRRARFASAWTIIAGAFMIFAAFAWMQ